MMNSNIKVSIFKRAELQADQQLIQKYAMIVRQEEETESDFPLPVPGLNFFKERFINLNLILIVRDGMQSLRAMI